LSSVFVHIIGSFAHFCLKGIMHRGVVHTPSCDKFVISLMIEVCVLKRKLRRNWKTKEKQVHSSGAGAYIGRSGARAANEIKSFKFSLQYVCQRIGS
jgi:hypothetical protein